MKNKEFIELLLQYPDNTDIAIFEKLSDDLVLCKSPSIRYIMNTLIIE